MNSVALTFPSQPSNPAETFKDDLTIELSLFDHQRDNLPKRTTFTWAEFCRVLKAPAIRKDKNGPAFSPAIFSGIRRKDNVVSVSMLVLDYDHEASWTNDLDVWKASGLRFAAYTTHSHLRKTESTVKEEERFRIVVPLKSPIPRQYYAALWRYAYGVTNGKIDRAASDESRLFYLPARADENAPYEYLVCNGELLDWTHLELSDLQLPERQSIAVSRSNGSFLLSPDVTANEARKNELWELEPRAFQSYERKRPSFKDQSASSYDLSLAVFCAQANWTDQEIVNLLIESRRKHGDDLKLREDYYRRTIALARSETPSLLSAIKVERDTVTGKRQNAINLLRELLNLPTLIGVIQRGTSNSIYELKLADASFIVLGTASVIRQKTKVADKLYDSGVILERISDEKWRETVPKAVREAVEIVETLPDSVELYGLVLSYLGLDEARFTHWQSSHFGIDLSDPDRELVIFKLSQGRGRGFYDISTGQAYLAHSDFIRFVCIVSGERRPAAEIKNLLSRYGFENRQKSLRYPKDSGKKGSYNVGRFWISRVGYLKAVFERE